MDADTKGNEGPTIKGLREEDPRLSEKQLESQAIPTLGITTLFIPGRCSWHKQTHCYNWQVAVMAFSTETRCSMAIGSASLLASQQPGWCALL